VVENVDEQLARWTYASGDQLDLPEHCRPAAMDDVQGPRPFAVVDVELYWHPMMDMVMWVASKSPFLLRCVMNIMCRNNNESKR